MLHQNKILYGKWHQIVIPDFTLISSRVWNKGPKTEKFAPCHYFHVVGATALAVFTKSIAYGLP